MIEYVNEIPGGGGTQLLGLALVGFGLLRLLTLLTGLGLGTLCTSVGLCTFWTRVGLWILLTVVGLLCPFISSTGLAALTVVTAFTVLTVRVPGNP